MCIRDRCCGLPSITIEAKYKPTLCINKKQPILLIKATKVDLFPCCPKDDAHVSLLKQ